METLDYYSIEDALDGMKDLVLEFPNGALVIGGGYNSFDEEFDAAKYSERDSTLLERVQIARQQGLYPAILNYPKRLTLYAYTLTPFNLYVWDETSGGFVRMEKIVE